MAGEVTLDVGDDSYGMSSAGAYVAVPERAAGPAVLVLHAWWGLNEFIKQFCDRLAAEGFVALAPDLYGGKVATTIDDAKQYAESMDGAAGGRIVDAAIGALLGNDSVSSASVSVIGFSLGAYFALDTAVNRPDDVGAVVIYYGTGDQTFSGARAAFLGHFAANDPYEEAAWVAEVEESIRASGNPVTFHTYPGTGHWFAEDDRPDAYDPAAAQLAWERTIAFLREPRSCE